MSDDKKQHKVIECPACEFKSKQSTKFEAHLNSSHGVTSQTLWDALNDGPKKCACGCGSTTRWLSWSKGYSDMICGHNANLTAVYGKQHAAEILAKRAFALRGRAGWSKGLTKETDARVAERGRATSRGRKSAIDEGKIKIWSKGLTKETDARVAAAAAQQHEDFAAGHRIAWQKNLSADQDPRIAQKNADLSARYANGELKQWHAGKTIKTDPRIAKFWAKRDPIREYAHVRFTDQQITERLSQNTRIRLERIEGYKNIYSTSIWMQCTACSWHEKVTFAVASGDRCPRCDANGSHAQSEIASWIESLGMVAKNNVVGIIGGRQEIDIFIPQRMFGIEFNGLYWHSENSGRDSHYHSRKTNRCAAIGISLLHVFEDDWAERRPVVESLIRHRMGLTARRIHARRCELVELSPKERRAFFDANHLDGDVSALIAFGLRLKGELVMALSLRKSFHRLHLERLEIARSCPLVNTTVRGGLSRLIRRALAECKAHNKVGLITYVDRRIGNGAGYIAAGMKKIGETPPRFWWTDFRRRFNRFKFKANSAEGLSEREVAGQAGVVKIWGCPNIVLMIAA